MADKQCSWPQSLQKLMNGAATASANALAALPAAELREDNEEKLVQIGFNAAKTFIGNELGKPGWERLSKLPSQLPKQPPPVVASQVAPPKPAPVAPPAPAPVAPPTPAPVAPPVTVEEKPKIVKPRPGPRRLDDR
jgi:hypothetical protein